MAALLVMLRFRLERQPKSKNVLVWSKTGQLTHWVVLTIQAAGAATQNIGTWKMGQLLQLVYRQVFAVTVYYL